jgi:hypothetical protein
MRSLPRVEPSTIRKPAGWFRIQAVERNRFARAELPDYGICGVGPEPASPLTRGREVLATPPRAGAATLRRTRQHCPEPSAAAPRRLRRSCGSFAGAARLEP